MVLDFIVAFFAAWGLFSLMEWVKTRLLSVCKMGKNIRLSTVISVSGSSVELEQTVKSLEHLRASGRLDGEIIIRNCGMDDDTAAVAEKMAESGRVRLII